MRLGFALLAVLVLAALAQTANAIPVSVIFEGEFSQYCDGFGQGSTAYCGYGFSGWYTFDDDRAPDHTQGGVVPDWYGPPGQTWSGASWLFAGGPYGMVIDIATPTPVRLMSRCLSIYMTDQYDPQHGNYLYSTDMYWISAGGSADPSCTSNFRTQMGFFDYTGQMFDGVSLSQIPPMTATQTCTFDPCYIASNSGDAGNYMTFSSMRFSDRVLPVVPEPSTLTLLGLGLAGLALTRRRKLH